MWKKHDKVGNKTGYKKKGKGKKKRARKKIEVDHDAFIFGINTKPQHKKISPISRDFSPLHWKLTIMIKKISF